MFQKRQIIATCSALCLLGMISVSATAQEEPPTGPFLDYSPGGIDLGEVTRGTVITREIPLKNAGDAELEILDVSSTCLCATATGPGVLQPGEVGHILVTLNATGLVGLGGTDVVFTTNVPSQPKVTIVVTANVKDYLLMEPSRNRFSTVQGEPDGTLENRLVSKDGSTFDILKIESPYEFLDLSFRELTPEERNRDVEGSQWAIFTAFPSMAPVGPLNGRIWVTTSHSKEERIDIPISGFVRPAYQLSPPTATFGKIVIDGPKRSPFWFKVFSSTPMVVKSAETDVEGIRLDLESPKEGREYKIVLNFDEDIPTGEFAGTLRLTLDNEKVPYLEYPLSGTIVHRTSEADGR